MLNYKEVKHLMIFYYCNKLRNFDMIITYYFFFLYLYFTSSLNDFIFLRKK